MDPSVITTAQRGPTSPRHADGCNYEECQSDSENEPRFEVVDHLVNTCLHEGTSFGGYYARIKKQSQKNNEIQFFHF